MKTRIGALELSICPLYLHYFFSPKKKTTSLALIVSFGILLWSTSSAFQNNDLSTYAQVTEVQQQEQEQQRITDNVNNSKTQIYGCAEFGESLHCDPFLNELITFRMLGNWSKITPVVNDNPRFVSIGKGSDHRSTEVGLAARHQSPGIN